MYNSDETLNFNNDETDYQNMVSPSLSFYMKLFICLFGTLFAILAFSQSVPWCLVMGCESRFRKEMCNELSPSYNASVYNCTSDRVRSVLGPQD